MESTNIFKGCLKELDRYGQDFADYDVMFKIINVANMYFFAKEIKSECIFPIANIIPNPHRDSYKSDTTIFLDRYSYLLRGCNYVYFPLQPKADEVFKYEVDHQRFKSFGISIPSLSEINKYCLKHDYTWNEIMSALEADNEYMCNLKDIKEVLKVANEMSYTDLEELLDVKDIEPTVVKYTPDIDLSSIKEFGIDLSTQNDLCDLIGREAEIKEIIKATAIKGKSVLLLGEAGSGKTSIVEKLALDIRNKKSKFLDDKIIFSLNANSLVAGTKYRGEFEKKIETLIEFCLNHKGKIILFIDEIHVLCGLGSSSESPTDAMNVLKPYISRGDITIIGATTKDEYEKYLAKDPALVRRFENIEVSIPDKNMNIKIMLNYIKSLENKFNLRFDISEDELLKVLEKIYNITDGKCAYVAGNVKIENPTLSKNIIENIFTEAVYNDKTSISMEEINFAIDTFDSLSLEFMSEFGYDMSKRSNLCNLVGREKELEEIIKALAIEETSVMLVGEPGTGKTSIVEKIALDIKNGNCNFLRDKTIFYVNVSSLTAGAKYVGEFEKKMNKLINSCRKNKGKVILFIDEIHTLYGLGRSSESSIDAMNMLKPYISSGELTIIGATTKKEYEKNMTRDSAFTRRFKIVEISVLDDITQTKILMSYTKDLEKKHNIKLNLNGLSLEYVMKYISEITDSKHQTTKDNDKVENPTLSKRLIESAFSDAIYNKKVAVTFEDIYNAIMNCDKLSIEFKKDCVETLKEYIQEEKVNNGTDILSYAKIKRKLLSRGNKVGFI